jgi:4,5-DOPA dioxygenase extradiol
MQMERMPVLFIGHGSPTNALENNRFTKSWEEIARALPRPKAILSVSAHWYTDGLFVNGAKKPEQIYDMYGFPKEFYEIKYPVSGDPELASEAASLTGAHVTEEWGIDHGTWAVLTRIFPDADIPVVQFSVDGNLEAEGHFEIGRKLAPLRDEGILIFGSGSIVHNLERVDWNMDAGLSWALSFDREIKEKIQAGDFDAVVKYGSLPSYTPKVFSTPEHFDPLLTVLGAAGKDDAVKVFSEGSTLGAISMTSYLLGRQAEEKE